VKARQAPGTNLLGGLPVVVSILGGLLNGLSIPSVVPSIARRDESALNSRQIGGDILGLKLGSGSNGETSATNNGVPVVGHLNGLLEGLSIAKRGGAAAESRQLPRAPTDRV